VHPAAPRNQPVLGRFAAAQGAEGLAAPTLVATKTASTCGRGMSRCPVDEADQSELAAPIHRRAAETRRFDVQDASKC
jgi:hypothetical protein